MPSIAAPLSFLETEALTSASIPTSASRGVAQQLLLATWLVEDGPSLGQCVSRRLAGGSSRMISTAAIPSITAKLYSSLSKKLRYCQVVILLDIVVEFMASVAYAELP
ncbi:hypothetical protein ACH5RR_039031 [Cinchona calisaya]|uniref:Uncharacterized protein n=1 Tax=Cinchona calisaya TaxID=153742 RepID=A0ABD2Y2M1_9GENT